MSTIEGDKKTKKLEEKKVEKLPNEKIIENLESELKDLSDLYNNVIKENKGLTVERNELNAKVVELQAILEDINDNHKSEISEYDEAIEDYSKDVAIKEAIITELSAHNENLNSIIEMLIRNS